jgi:hypothetical protein
VNMLDQANRFAQGENVKPVTLEWRQGASTTLWHVLVLGGKAQAPGTFVSQADYKLLFPVSVQIVRRGQWLTFDSTNLALNGGFETWTGSPLVPSNWTLTLAGSAAVGRESTIVDAGTYSAHATIFGTGDSISQLVVAAEEGFSYRVTARVYVVLEGVTMTLTGDGGWVKDFFQTETVDFLDADRWVTVSAVAVAGATGITISFAGLAAGSEFYVDSVSVTSYSEVSGDAGDLATAAAVDNGDVAALGFTGGTTAIIAPTKLIIEHGGMGTYNLDSYLALTETNIRAINSSTLDASWGAAFVSTADSAAYARGGNVLRYTPTVTTEVINTLTGDDLERRAAVFVKVRNNSSTASYTIRGGVRQPSIDVWNQPVVVAPQAAARPETIYLGEVTFSPPSLIRIGITASATGAGTLDIETFYIVDLSSGESSIIRLGRDSGAVGVPGNRFITVNHNALTGLEPNVTVTTVTGVSNWTARGKLSVYTRSPNLQAVFLGTGSNTTLNTWRQVLTTTVIANDWTASRLPGVLIPE